MDYDFTESIPSLFIGVLIVFGSDGVQFDLTNQKVRKYYGFFFFKIGIWVDLGKYNYIETTRVNSSKTVTSGHSVWMSRTFKEKGYDVFISSSTGQKRLFLARFAKYPYAKEFMNEYSKKINLKTLDRIQRARESSLKKRAEGDKNYTV